MMPECLGCYHYGRIIPLDLTDCALNHSHIRGGPVVIDGKCRDHTPIETVYTKGKGRS